MKEQADGNKVEQFFGIEKDKEETKYDENKEDNQKMSDSFYSKEGLDFLYFNRPGTAYGSFGATQEKMMGTQTRSQFFMNG
jgi:hypothetical protein